MKSEDLISFRAEACFLAEVSKTLNLRSNEVLSDQSNGATERYKVFDGINEKDEPDCGALPSIPISQVCVYIGSEASFENKVLSSPKTLVANELKVRSVLASLKVVFNASRREF